MHGCSECALENKYDLYAIGIYVWYVGERLCPCLAVYLPYLPITPQTGGPTPTPTVGSSPSTSRGSDSDDPLLETGDIVAVVVVGGAFILAGAVVVIVLILLVCSKQSKFVFARKKMSSIYLSMGHIRSGTRRKKTSAVVQMQTQRSAPYTDYDSVSSGSPNAAVAFLNPVTSEVDGQTVRFD